MAALRGREWWRDFNNFTIILLAMKDLMKSKIYPRQPLLKGTLETASKDNEKERKILNKGND